MNQFGIYIHIPFCKQSCHYCNFHHSTNIKLKEELIQAILVEIFLRKDELQNKKITSIYFGGGTPSIISFLDIENILLSILKICNISTSTEITIEINPDDVNSFFLDHYKKIGINRLSLGVQSFNDNLLKWLNRSHSSQKAIDAIELIKFKGFDNFNIDLIYSIPESDRNILFDDLKKLVSFSPAHISAYNLSIEKKTVLGYRLEKKIINKLSDNEEIFQYKFVVNFLKNHGYHHYEISNFCQPTKESKHNSGYWNDNFEYVGFGPSAHSYNGKIRKVNVNNNYTYINMISHLEFPFTEEVLSYQNKINEYIMTSLRTIKGCNLTTLLSKFDLNLLKSKQHEINYYKTFGFCYIEDNNLKLSEDGLLLADDIASNLFV